MFNSSSLTIGESASWPARALMNNSDGGDADVVEMWDWHSVTTKTAVPILLSED